MRYPLAVTCRYILENYLHRKWTEDDVEKADMFFRSVSRSIFVQILLVAVAPASPMHRDIMLSKACW